MSTASEAPTTCRSVFNLARYPAFVQAAWKVILSGFSRDTLAEIRKGAFRTAFPGALLQLIKLEVDKLSEEEMDELRLCSAETSSNSPGAHSAGE